MLSNDCTLDTCIKHNLARVLDQNLVLVWWNEMTKNCGWCAVGNRPHSILCTELPRVPRKVAFHDWGTESQANQNAYLILVQHTPTVCWRRGTSSWAGEADEHNSTQPDNYQTRSWIRRASCHIMNWRFTLCGIVECRADRPHGARRAVHVLIRSLSDFTASLTGSWSLPRWVLIWIRRALFYTKVDCHT